VCLLAATERPKHDLPFFEPVNLLLELLVLELGGVVVAAHVGVAEGVVVVVETGSGEGQRGGLIVVWTRQPGGTAVVWPARPVGSLGGGWRVAPDSGAPLLGTTVNPGLEVDGDLRRSKRRGPGLDSP